VRELIAQHAGHVVTRTHVPTVAEKKALPFPDDKKKQQLVIPGEAFYKPRQVTRYAQVAPTVENLKKLQVKLDETNKKLKEARENYSKGVQTETLRNYFEPLFARLENNKEALTKNIAYINSTIKRVMARRNGQGGKSGQNGQKTNPGVSPNSPTQKVQARQVASKVTKPQSHPKAQAGKSVPKKPVIKMEEAKLVEEYLTSKGVDTKNTQIIENAIEKDLEKHTKSN
jgi:hypothetical protein